MACNSFPSELPLSRNWKPPQAHPLSLFEPHLGRGWRECMRWTFWSRNDNSRTCQGFLFPLFFSCRKRRWSLLSRLFSTISHESVVCPSPFTHKSGPCLSIAFKLFFQRVLAFGRASSSSTYTSFTQSQFDTLSFFLPRHLDACSFDSLLQIWDEENCLLSFVLL